MRKNVLSSFRSVKPRDFVQAAFCIGRGDVRLAVLPRLKEWREYPASHQPVLSPGEASGASLTISDLHLGSNQCETRELRAFLKAHPPSVALPGGGWLRSAGDPLHRRRERALLARGQFGSLRSAAFGLDQPEHALIDRRPDHGEHQLFLEPRTCLCLRRQGRVACRPMGRSLDFNPMDITLA